LESRPSAPLAGDRSWSAVLAPILPAILHPVFNRARLVLDF
jgi:hypothetical protein